MTYSKIKTLLCDAVEISPQSASAFFKTGPGEYAEFDRFLGVRVPRLRAIAKQFPSLPLSEIAALLDDAFNEARLLALLILTHQYHTTRLTAEQACIYQFYLAHRHRVNNWNLVDYSAHRIVGAHLWDKKRDVLIMLTQSNNLWERRIAIVATFYFIQRKDLSETLCIVRLLLYDKQDLIHKAAGWMLREVGKKDVAVLRRFLEQHGVSMPRTMLRYAIEKLPEKERKAYLSL